jgi:putative transposase
MEDESEAERVAWEEASRREAVVRDLLKGHPKRLTIKAVETAGWELGLSRATMYRVIEQFRLTPTVSGLLPGARGRPKGFRLLRAEQEAVICEVAQCEYLTPTRPPLRHLVEHVRRRFRQEGWVPPTWRTVKARILEIDARTRARRRGDPELLRATNPTPGEYVASRPLEIVQIDHTEVDVIVVDEQSRKTIGRPWITLAIDVATRMVTGFYLSLEPPSRASIGLCLLHAVYDKTAWLAERGIEVSWPVAGLPDTLHVDNGADFRSRTFIRACREEGIHVLFRPPKQPHYGGHIERLIGTQMGAVHLLPGTTFSHPGKRGDYSSSQAAMMTLRELERWIAWEIAGHYHQRIHASLHRPPIAVWKDGEALRHLRLPTDRMKFWVSFLPDDERTLQRDGIHFCNIRYWADALAADLGRTKGKVLIKYDPRDLSRIFVRRPSGRFVEARYRNLGWPAITLWEQKAAMKYLRAKGRAEIDEAMIFKTTLRQREIEDRAAKQTAALRRRRARRPAQRGDEHDAGTLRGIDSRVARDADEGSETWRD